MGSNSSSASSSSSSFDPEKYGEWTKREPSKDYTESDIKVTKLKWRDVKMTSKLNEALIDAARAGSLGFGEIKAKGKRISHDIIVVITDKGPNYVLEWNDSNMLRAGYYNKYYQNKYNAEKYDYTPKKEMKLSDLRNLMNENEGDGDCKDHARLWWKKIKEKY